MVRYNSLKHRPRYFQAFTGLKVEEFDRLIAQSYSDWISQRIERLTKNNPDRKRKIGAGRKKALETLEDQLLLALIWSRIYPSYLFLEYLFNIDESTVCRTIKEIVLLIQDRFVFRDPRKSGRKQIRTLEELREIIPDIDEILADATEQKIPRPEKKFKRKKYHSGKKKAFTVKTQLATNKQGLIIYTSRASPGRIHDYKLFKESSLARIIPQKTRIYLDSGYQGIKKDFPDLNSIIPFKRTRNHQKLTHSEKIQNTKQRRVRVKVEHAISQLKKFNVLSHIYRHSLQNYDQTFAFIVNIVNFRMLQRLAMG